ncbi:MAG: tRNA (5-methylaminomethyl-2-thiouridine)(34)-methyltransferase MnmD [Alphaproteobacteria bacterium]|nr:tRNA (5-methylaminomethyl-2-thiouridine)(34)-methyltransferase MnmD [Alphaproteobacteria bacterium]
MANQQADVIWRGAVPISARFDDPYYSLDDGVAETGHVFLGGNDLPARLVPGFHIAELGFGTGLNLLVTVQAVCAAGLAGPVRFTSFEAYPMTAEDMETALAGFPELAEDATRLVAAWRGGARFTLPGVEVEVILGDANDTLPAWGARADAWYLDGFAPARNPGLWSPGLMAEVARHTAPGGTAATYSAAGDVRRGLQAAGFDVARVPGFGRKRHMTVARLP